MLSYKESLQELAKISASGNMTLDDVSSLAGKLDIIDNKAAGDAVTHLYSKVSITGVIDLADDGIRVLNRTDAFAFLDSKDFDDAVYQAIRNGNPNLDYKAINTIKNDYLYGVSTNGSTGPWADVSLRFAAETKGDVVAHMGMGAEGRTMVNVELPEIINNPSVNSFELIPEPTVTKEELSRVTDKLIEGLMTQEERAAFRSVMTGVAKLSPSEVSEAAFRTYLRYSGKSFSEFGIVDDIILGFAEKSPLAKMNPADAKAFNNL